MTFFLGTRPDLQAKRATMSWRTEQPAAVHSDLQPAYEPDLEDCTGGGGVYTHPSEFFKILKALLRATDPSTVDQDPPAAHLLRRSTALAMFEPSLSNVPRDTLMRVTEIPRFNHMMGNMPIGTPKDHTVGGLLVQKDLPGWRSKGTLTWGGTPNLTWVSINSILYATAFSDLYIVD